MAAIKATKKELRQKIKGVLKDLTTDHALRQTNHALTTLFALPEWQAARRISVYLSMPSGEISTEGIVVKALDQGKKVFVPYIHKRKADPPAIMDMLELHSQEDYAKFKPDNWGIPSVPKESIESRLNSFGGRGTEEVVPESSTGHRTVPHGLDLIILPGMAFDSKFGRLGHGKGFYDYFLQRCHQQSTATHGLKMPFLVGLALKEQLLSPEETVPTDATDWRLDALIVGDGQLLRAEARP